MTAELESNMERTDMRMIRCMCGVSLKEMQVVKELRCRLCDNMWYVGGERDSSCRLVEEDLSEKLWKMVSADVCLLKG